MSWLTTKRAHILSISLFSKRLNHLLAPLFQALLCAVFSTWKLASYFYTFFALYFLHSDCLLPWSNLASFSAPLLHFFFAHSPSLLPFFCTMPQGPPGPQGSPHPQPPPPNSMMGPHSQVMLRLSLLSSFLLSVHSYGSIGSQCWCFMLWHSLLLTDLSCIHINLNTTFIDLHWPESHGTLLFLSQSFMSPRFAGGPRGPPIRMSSQVEVAFMYMSHPVYKTATFNQCWCCFPVSHQGEVLVLIPCCPTWTRQDHKVWLVHSQLHWADNLPASPHLIFVFPSSRPS